MAEENWTEGLVVALFPDREQAERGIRRLQDAGFAREHIGVAMRERTVQGELVEETGTKAAEGAATGAVSGGILGGILGLLVGVGALVIPGVGPVVAGGALASALGVAGGTAVAGAGIGAAAGGVLGALIGAGIPEEEARYFDERFRQGGVLVTVTAGVREQEAREILVASGADIGPRGQYASTTAGAGSPVWSGVERRRPQMYGRRRTDVRPAYGA